MERLLIIYLAGGKGISEMKTSARWSDENKMKYSDRPREREREPRESILCISKYLRHVNPLVLLLHRKLRKIE